MTAIGEINYKIGPLFGPNMLRLLQVLRSNFNYHGSSIPSEMARFALSQSPLDIDLGQQPEVFAANALGALGFEVDKSTVDEQAKRFEQTLQFHNS